MAAVDLLAAFQLYADQLAVFDEHVADALLETHFTAQRLDLFAHGGDHAGQAKGADVRLADIHDFVRRTGLYEFFQHLAAVVVGVLDLAVQLAVGKGPRAALAELHVGLGIEHVLAPQAPGVLGALAHFLAPFQHDRPESHLGEQQSGKDAARTEADHQRALCRLLLGSDGQRLVAHVRGDAKVAVIVQARQQRGFVTHAEIEGVDEGHVTELLAGIVAALEHAELEQLAVVDTQALYECRANGIVRVVEGQFQFGDAQHVGLPFRAGGHPAAFRGRRLWPKNPHEAAVQAAQSTGRAEMRCVTCRIRCVIARPHRRKGLSHAIAKDAYHRLSGWPHHTALADVGRGLGRCALSRL